MTVAINYLMYHDYGKLHGIGMIDDVH
jgi:hypothetical protein